MVDSPDNLLDDLVATHKELRQVQEKGGSAQRVAVLRNLFTLISCELQEMELHEEALRVLERGSVTATCEDVL